MQLVNKKVSYRSTRVTKILARTGGVVDPAEIFLRSSLIAMQNLVAVSHAVCAHAGGPIFFLGGGEAEVPPLNMEVCLTPGNMAIPAKCYHRLFGRSRSNGWCVIMMMI